MALNSNALTTLAKLTAMGLTQSTTILEDAINLASEVIEAKINRKLGYVAGSVELLQGSGCRKLFLPRYPIISITEILMEGEAVDSSTYSLTDTGKEQGWVYRNLGWPLFADVEYPTGDSIPDSDYLPFQVTYSGGFLLPNMSPVVNSTPLLLRIQKACEIMCYDWVTKPTSTGGRILKERSATGWQIELEARSNKDLINEIIPLNALALLAGLKRLSC